MIGRSTLSLLFLLVAFASGFSPLAPRSAIVEKFSQATLDAKGDDWGDFESRDMTRAEMEALNQENEKVMNAELIGMTAFSLVISIPMLYLVWVGFFSETAGDFDL